MDDYVEYYYRREPAIRTLNYGDITDRKKVRERLQCKPFQWFMENIAYDVLEKFPPPSKNLVWGEVKRTCHRLGFDRYRCSFSSAKTSNMLSV
jgi:polypeptide N-acetylgalactosaminyltransferase